MKILVIMIIYSGIYSYAVAQPVVAQVKDFETSATSIEKLNSTYKPAVDKDPDLAVFNRKARDFHQAHMEMINSLSRYLNMNGFYWDEPVRSYTHVFFSADGKVDYFLFDFLSGDMDPGKQDMFRELSKGFFTNYRFPMQANNRFRHSAPVNFRDAELTGR